MNCKFCDHQYEPDDTAGVCPQCQYDAHAGQPFFGADLNPEDEVLDRRKEWRSGSSAAQRQNTLNAKATLAFLRTKPNGATKAQIIAAGITPSLDLLEKHNLAFWDRTSHMHKRPGIGAIWHARRIP